MCVRVHHYYTYMCVRVYTHMYVCAHYVYMCVCLLRICMYVCLLSKMSGCIFKINVLAFTFICTCSMYLLQCNGGGRCPCEGGWLSDRL